MGLRSHIRDKQKGLGWWNYFDGLCHAGGQYVLEHNSAVDHVHRTCGYISMREAWSLPCNKNLPFKVGIVPYTLLVGIRRKDIKRGQGRLLKDQISTGLRDGVTRREDHKRKGGICVAC